MASTVFSRSLVAERGIPAGFIVLCVGGITAPGGPIIAEATSLRPGAPLIADSTWLRGRRDSWTRSSAALGESQLRELWDTFMSDKPGPAYRRGTSIPIGRSKSHSFHTRRTHCAARPPRIV